MPDPEVMTEVTDEMDAERDLRISDKISWVSCCRRASAA